MSAVEWALFAFSTFIWLYTTFVPDSHPNPIITDWSWCPDGRHDGYDDQERCHRDVPHHD